MTSPLTGNVSQSAEDCIVLDINDTVPWDNPRNLMSPETEYLIDRIKSAVFIPILYLIGVPANTVSMLVFYRQGLKERIILCLFSLACVDLIYLTLLFLMYAERIYTQFTTGERFGPVYQFLMNNNVVGLYGIGYTSMFLAALISSERCLCVLFPMKSKTYFKTRTTALVIIIGGCVTGFLRFAITAQYRVACFFEKRASEKTYQIYVTDYYLRNKEFVTKLDIVFYGFLMTVGCPLVVLITTTITTLKLRQTIAWRRQSTSTDLSSKEVGLTKMLICLSVEFFVLSIPYIILRVAPLFIPQLSAGGDYRNTLWALLSVAELGSYVSSSVNFFVYYFAGSRFRETLHAMVKRKTKKLRKEGARQKIHSTFASESTIIDSTMS
nr:hypothetical protein BaRGS_034069 [Batillaria attramentaria]